MCISRIPIFTSQLEKSRDAVSVANLRAAYAEAATTALTEDETKVEETVDLKGTKKDNFSGLATELPFALDTTITDKDGNPGKITVEFDFTDPDSVKAIAK